MSSARRPSTATGALPNRAQTPTDVGSSTPQPIRKRHSAQNLASPVPTTPPRPPRNPARESQKAPKIKRPSTSTGVPSRDPPTPWEVFPSSSRRPMDSAASLNSPSGKRAEILPWEYTATGKLADVLPWETEQDPPSPLPAKPGVVNGVQTPANHPRQSRASISSSIHDMALLRRRKSTGTKAFPNGVSTRPLQPLTPITSPSKPASVPAKVLHKVSSASTVRPPLVKTASGPIPTLAATDAEAPSSPQTPEQGSQDPKFSTADRAILKELKRNMSARAAQFVVKGGPAENARGATLMRSGTKHHAYSRDEVPYPRSYAREVLDLDIWETMACQTICDSVTWHVFSTPPTRVLDIGCGTGTWILNCGKQWRNCQFVGLDVVPLHPNLGSSELASRITWVQANFLEGLPFPNDEFDFVHIKRIALGVPEDKWDGLFEEIVRVLKPGGAFELLEEDLFFPGKLADDEVDSDSDTLSEMRYARETEGSDADDGDSIITTSAGSRQSNETPNTSLGAMPPTPPRTVSPLPIQDIIEEMPEETTPKPSIVASPAHPSHRHSSYQPRIPSAPNSLPTTTTSSTVSLHASATPSPTDRRGKPRGYSTSTTLAPSNQHPPVLFPSSSGGPTKATAAPFLLRTLTKAPPNPRDHSLLEKIYNEMNAARFINMSPLSLLANLVGVYFKDVRTHPPLQMTFPPPAAPQPEEATSSDEDTDSDGARNAIIPRPSRRQSVQSTLAPPNSPRSAIFGDSSTLAEETRWLHTSDLLKRESRYISLDEARMSAFSPSARSSFPAMSPARPLSGLPVVDTAEASSVGAALARGLVAGNRNRLPNQTLHIDMRSLNMHLALRTAEVLACAESMWEWVKSYQDAAKPQRVGGRQRAGSLASEMPPRSSRLPMLPPNPELDAFKRQLLELTREDFDALLSKFDLDMRDHIGIGQTLRDHFSWSCMPIAPSAERKAFITACERWDQWQEQNRRKVRVPFVRSSVDGSMLESGVSRGRSSLPGGARSRPSSTASSRTTPPDRRLSRSFRVFAAWKA
ncbi:Methyltransf-25 domain-containing protein [Mycena chlorophos]|uniref:Methyltransf-25 domain-containing protein n=1 Tax=Mycena chlorophos TaxID=658473 RepID=A0A8H6RVE8_MYCCL|nr:Methyltransf-25 domain-containing protein [Mycena chlorophos]